MSAIRVMKAGIQSTIQDLGRFGFRKIGVPISGAMDSKSMRDANTIVGNSEGAPVIEHTFYGGEYEFSEQAIIAITGARCTPTVNEKAIPCYKAIFIEKGDRIELNHPTRGCRAYLAIQGSFNNSKVMESFSTYIPGKFGGFEGRSLQSGDILDWNCTTDVTLIKEFRTDEIPYFSTKNTIQINKGPEFDTFEETVIKLFFSTSFQVGSQSNRMGIRLFGDDIKPRKMEMVSSPVLPGVIQLPPSGNPILLMKDAQTIGGYPRIGLVKESELWRLGQLKSGDIIRFKL